MAEKKYPGNAEGEKKLSDLIAAGKPTAKNATVAFILFLNLFSLHTIKYMNFCNFCYHENGQNSQKL